MPHSNLTAAQEANFNMARAASHYSQRFIVKGSSQLINNTYDKTRRLALNKAVKDRRNFSGNYYPAFNLETKYLQFQLEIEHCRKFSLGNCYEMALMALDYILRYTPPHVNAEIYRIQGGDHIFLVLGRKKGSHPNKPETWGDNAFICDPWSDKVYLASEYLKEMQSYYYEYVSGDSDCDSLNYTANLKEGQVLCPRRFENVGYYQNTDYLRRIYSLAHLDEIISHFQKKMEVILKVLEKLKGKLLLIMERFADENDDLDKKKYH